MPHKSHLVKYADDVTALVAVPTVEQTQCTLGADALSP